MNKLILVCGPTGAGKTTYSKSISEEISAVRFSIDPWMQNLFAQDMKSLDYSWILNRVGRCCDQIWEVSEQILKLGGNVVLDLGFTTRKQRELFTSKANKQKFHTELHYLDVPLETRKQRVKQRNIDKDPELYSFEITDFMFNFMEPKFEIPGEKELKNGFRIECEN